MTQSNISYSHLSNNPTFYDANQLIFNSLVQAIIYISLYLILRTISLYFQQAHRVKDAYTKLIRRFRIRKSPLLSVVDAQMQKSIIVVAPYTTKQTPWMLLFRSAFAPPKNLNLNAKPYNFRSSTIRALESKEQPTVWYKKPVVSWPPKKDDVIDGIVQRTLPSDLLGLWRRHEISMENYVRFFPGQPSKRRRRYKSSRQPQQAHSDMLDLQDNSDSVTSSRYELYLLAREVLSYYESEYGYQRGTPEAERIIFLRQAISDFTS